MSKKIMINGILQSDKGFDPEKSGSNKYIYEVLRIIDGKVLFAPEHYQRLLKSLESVHCQITFTLEEFCEQIHTLAKANKVLNDNVKLIADNFRGPKDYDVCMFIIGAHYPSASEYEMGVATELFKAVRPDPHVKVRNQPLRDATNALIKDHGLFEVILVDEEGHITEGSRSNIFFIKNGALYTSPAEAVLLGVTRKEIIEVCKGAGIDVIEETIAGDQIDAFDAAFVSGTSPKVLPIARIGELQLDVNNKTLREIMDLYNRKITASLS